MKEQLKQAVDTNNLEEVKKLVLVEDKEILIEGLTYTIGLVDFNFSLNVINHTEENLKKFQIACQIFKIIANQIDFEVLNFEEKANFLNLVEEFDGKYEKGQESESDSNNEALVKDTYKGIAIQFRNELNSVLHYKISKGEDQIDYKIVETIFKLGPVYLLKQRNNYLSHDDNYPNASNLYNFFFNITYVLSCIECVNKTEKVDWIEKIYFDNRLVYRLGLYALELDKQKFNNETEHFLTYVRMVITYDNKEMIGKIFGLNGEKDPTFAISIEDINEGGVLCVATSYNHDLLKLLIKTEGIDINQSCDGDEVFNTFPCLDIALVEAIYSFNLEILKLFLQNPKLSLYNNERLPLLECLNPLDYDSYLAQHKKELWIEDDERDIVNKIRLRENLVRDLVDNCDDYPDQLFRETIIIQIINENIKKVQGDGSKKYHLLSRAFNLYKNSEICDQSTSEMLHYFVFTHKITKNQGTQTDLIDVQEAEGIVPIFSPKRPRIDLPQSIN